MTERTINFKVSVTAPYAFKEAELRNLVEDTLERKVRRIAGAPRGERAIKVVRLRTTKSIERATQTA